MIAHIRKTDWQIQTVNEHCKGTALRAEQTLEPLGLGAVGRFEGIVHDMGKAKEEFSDYISKAVAGEKVERGKVNHTFAAPMWILEKWKEVTGLRKMAVEILAWSVGSHHGMFDCFDKDSNCGFTHRVEADKDEIHYIEATENFFKECISEEELEQLGLMAIDQLESKLNELQANCSQSKYTNKPEYNGWSAQFMAGLLARLCLSALIDADRSDTADFELNRTTTSTLADISKWQEALKGLEGYLDKLAECDSGNSPINLCRRQISDEAVASASKCRNGIYKLPTQTGGGKTLTSLRFALKCCSDDLTKRCFFVIPLLSVLEQNSKEIRKRLSDKDMVCEHHSNIVKTKMKSDELDRYELATQSWTNPVMVTTLVQLLNTLFSDSTQCIRRMVGLCHSVIVIDEIQTVPVKCISMINLALDFLADFCGCVILLCSATQPRFELIKYKLSTDKNCNVVSSSDDMNSIFKRTEIIDKISTDMDSAEIGNFALDLMSGISSLLIICNTKSSCRKIYKYIDDRADEFDVFNLTTHMCMKHREDTTLCIKQQLERSRKGGKKLICVSTQLVECGVDFSFESVIRMKAGLDSIAQSAGRCNRNNEYGKLSKVYIMSYENENLSKLKDIKRAQEATSAFLYKFHAMPEAFDNDILSNKSIAKYYEIYLTRKMGADTMEYPLGPEVSTETLFDMLSINSQFAKSPETNKYYVRQAFKTAGEQFKVFEDDTIDVIVPYDKKSNELIAQLDDAKAMHDIRYLQKLIQQAKPYTVSLFSYEVDKLVDSGWMVTKERFNYLLSQAYDENLGVKIEEESNF